ncbi:hypothetical protein [Ancrocorticia populi]|uniref:hypothetical protein n=1 Tax=Ancrocorticia populi TaxID=2175228 RepID=UPI003F9C5267
MAHTVFVFEPTDSRDKLTSKDEFSINRFAVGTTIDATSDGISFDAEGRVSVSFEGDLPIDERQAVRNSVERNLPLRFVDYA